MMSILPAQLFLSLLWDHYDSLLICLPVISLIPFESFLANASDKCFYTINFLTSLLSLNLHFLQDKGP